jgi:hypothetical protein
MSEAAPNGKDDVRPLQRVLRRLPIRQNSEPERVGLGEGAASHHGGDYGRLQPPREGLELSRRVRRDHAAARDEERSAGPAEISCRLLQEADIARRATALAGRREAPCHGRREEIGRNRQRDRAGPPSPEEMKRALDCAGDLRPAAEGVRPPADRSKALDLIRHFVQGAHVLTD